MKVVLVEDSPEVQRALSRLLGTLDGVHVVGCAADVRGAAELIDASEPDVVVLDVALHGGDRGIEVLRHAKHRKPDVDVVVLSNFGWDAMRDAFLGAGACAYFDKALEFAKVPAWIEARRQRVQHGPGSVVPSQRASKSAIASG